MNFTSGKYQIIFLVTVMVYLLIHLVTLTSYPLPWYDETYMAAIGKAFLETGRFTKTVAYFTDTPTEDLRYGPMYFIVAAFVFKVLGFGIFQFRLIAFIAGIFTFWLSLKIYFTEKNNVLIAWCIIAVLAIDSFYFRCMHEGRMDLLASCFMLTAHLFILKVFHLNKKDKTILKALFIAGFFAAISLLTSPRLGFALPLLFIYLLGFFIFKNPSLLLKALISFLLPFVSIYSIWIFYAFGGYTHFINFYIENLGYTRLNGYPFYFPKQQIPLLAICIISVFLGVLQKKGNYFTPLSIMALINIASYYLVVYDNGPYASLIYPYLYIIIFINFEGSFWKEASEKIFKTSN
ncbi:MAG: glycosyltransferase family 39 protein [Bacteroidota bacterium]